MKHLYRTWLCVTGLVMATACEHEPLEYHVEKPLSFEAQEAIDAYGDLKTYVNREANPEFKLGAGIASADYLAKGVMYRLVNRNFDEVTPRTELNHGAIVQSNGSLSLGNAELLVSTVKTAGASVYGQSLTWHLNQNAAYLKGLLTPLIVESPAFINSLNLTGLTSGTLQGWSTTTGVSVVENEGMGRGKAVKLVSGNGASQPQDLQLVSPEITVAPGKEYEVILYIKSDKPGEGRVAFEGLNNNTPEVDWMKTGKATATFATTPGWKEIKFRIRDFQGDKIRLHFDLGYQPGVTYLLDAKNFYVYDTQGERIVNNLVPAGDFETGSGFGGWGNGSTRGVTEAGMGVQGGKAFWVTNPSKTGGFWEVQTLYELPGGPLQNGKVYNLSFWVKGTAEGVIRPEMQSSDFSSNGFGQVSVTTEWKHVQLATTINAETRNRFVISYGEFAGTVYIDKVVLTMEGATSGGETTVVEKTPEEKKAILLDHMEHWISGMVKTLSPYVNAWNVVKEPLDDANPAELKTGAGKANLAGDEFYWQDYMGRDYAAQAFKLAREQGKASDLLFISDNNLHSNLNKCRELIKYVEYLESQGATVDGIDTQMRIGIDTNKDGIREMLELLAATGKQIRISEFEVTLGVANGATEAHYAAQKEMYQYVVETYMQIIPAGKRYGITTWSPTADPTGLWTSGLNRKPAYSGFADGLKGAR
ncbi:endo-1,4-beta-xylanase [Pontibacter beigongshangensis]|uniref:endo-1,4-beta-xylanase n=1 Tax=Pontibacter beigongshangensis TaxID=2574733 RepID=UPI0016502FF0|nr:endo-1,4-beta-xylanase [Pontibacter beigongshangensis]